MDNLDSKWKYFGNINKLYQKTTFLDKYGTDLYISIIMIIAFSIAISYFHILNNLQPLKADWINQRCKPSVLPFAGLINAPKGTDKMKYTAENFVKCTESILGGVVENAFMPVYYLFGLLGKTDHVTTDAIKDINVFFDRAMHNVSKNSAEIMRGQLKLSTQLIKFGSSLNAIFKKSYSLIINFTYNIQQLWVTLISWLTAQWNALMIQFWIEATALVISAAVIIVIAFSSIFDFGISLPIAIALSIIWIATFTDLLAQVLPAALFIQEFESDLVPDGNLMPTMPKPPDFSFGGIQNTNCANPPCCFGKNTLLRLANGEEKPIINIKVGDILLDSSKVTAWLELSVHGQDIYNLHGTIVTGRHRVFHEDYGLIDVKYHPDSYQIEDYRHSTIYCINTDSKQFILNGMIFTDWDDLDEMDMLDLIKNCEQYLPEKFKKSDIHKYLDCGFTGDMQIELEYGETVNIKDIEVNDILRFGERVLGVVEIDGRDMKYIKKYYVEGKEIKGSANIHILDNDLGNIYLFDIEGDNIENPEKLYHLITDTGTFNSNSIYFKDYYNSGLESYLDDENLEFLSIQI
jgi:hypothetical protein